MLDQLVASFSVIADQTQANMHFLAGILLLLWGVYLLNLILGGRLLHLGILPRHVSGLPGIICAPFLHANFNHLFFNSIPLIVLANFILIQGVPYFLQVTFLIVLLSGTLTWCFAKHGLHVGASAVITGYWALLIADSYQQSTLTAIILAIICIYYFAGIFFLSSQEKKVFPGRGIYLV